MKQLILIAIAFATLQTSAQDRRQHRQQNHRDMMKELTPEERATIKTKHMTLELDLNESQQSEVKALILKHATKKQQKMDARKEETKDSKKEISKEEHVKRINEKLDDQIEMKAKMKAILTAEQYEKWNSMTHHKHKQRKHKKKRKERH